MFTNESMKRRVRGGARLSYRRRVARLRRAPRERQQAGATSLGLRTGTRSQHKPIHVLPPRIPAPRTRYEQRHVRGRLLARAGPTFRPLRQEHESLAELFAELGEHVAALVASSHEPTLAKLAQSV